MLAARWPLVSGRFDMEKSDDLVAFLRSPDCTERAIGAHGGWLWQTDTAHRFVYMSDGVGTFGRRPADFHYGKTRQEIGNLCVDDPSSAAWLAALERREGFGPFDFVRIEDASVVAFRTVGVACHDARGRFTGYSGLAFRVRGAGERPPIGRCEHRHRVMQLAEIIIGSRQPLLCVVEEISSHGARLLAPDLSNVPGVFLLRCDAADSKLHVCELRWQNGATFGVSFANKFP